MPKLPPPELLGVGAGGGVVAGLTVTDALAVLLAPEESVTVTIKLKVVADETEGAKNEACEVVELVKLTEVPEVCVHR